MKIVKVKALCDIVYNGAVHKKGSEPFNMDEKVAKNLAKTKSVEVVKS